MTNSSVRTNWIVKHDFPWTAEDAAIPKSVVRDRVLSYTARGHFVALCTYASGSEIEPDDLPSKRVLASLVERGHVTVDGNVITLHSR